MLKQYQLEKEVIKNEQYKVGMNVKTKKERKKERKQDEKGIQTKKRKKKNQHQKRKQKSKIPVKAHRITRL